MALSPTTYSTRSISVLMLAAFAGLGLWMYAPWGSGNGAGSGSGGDASAALPPSLRVDGHVQVVSRDDVVTRVVVPLAVSGSESITLREDDGGLRAETSMSDTASASVPASYAITWLDGNGDRKLDPGEHAVLTADLPARSSVHPGNPLRLVLHSAGEPAVVIEHVLP